MLKKSVLLILLLTASAGFAQTDRGTLRGLVTDSAGAVIPGANVQATNNASGETFPVVTNASGVYNITALLPGRVRRPEPKLKNAAFGT